MADMVREKKSVILSEAKDIDMLDSRRSFRANNALQDDNFTKSPLKFTQKAKETQYI